MLDIFLETVSERTKVAEANGRLMAQLERLPTRELRKIASYGLPPSTKIGEDQGCWLEKFRGSPLFEEAIAIEKEELEVQTSEMERRRAQMEMDASVPRWDETDLHRQELSIRRKMLELELAGADMSGSPEDAEFEDEDPAAAAGAPPPPAAVEGAPPDLEAAEAAAMPPVPKAAPPAPKDAGPPGPPPVAVGGQEGEDAEGPPAEDAGPPAKAEGEGPPAKEDKPKPKPPTTKVTKETVEKPVEEKIDVKAAAARMRFAWVVKEAQPANGVRFFRR